MKRQQKQAINLHVIQFSLNTQTNMILVTDRTNKDFPSSLISQDHKITYYPIPLPVLSHVIHHPRTVSTLSHKPFNGYFAATTLFNYKLDEIILVLRTTIIDYGTIAPLWDEI